MLTGAGTSAFIGEVAGPYLTGRLRRRVDAIATTDLVADPVELLAEDVPTLLVSFARSGDSPESTAATSVADQLLGDLHHLVITCDPNGALHRAHSGRADSFVLDMPARANDEGFAMTSSFTSMLLSVLLVLGGDADVEALASAAEWVLGQRDRIEALAVREPARIVYLGSGGLTGLARESALKLLETAAGRIVAVHRLVARIPARAEGARRREDLRRSCSAPPTPTPAPTTRTSPRELRGAIGEESCAHRHARVSPATAGSRSRASTGCPTRWLALPYRGVRAAVRAAPPRSTSGVSTDNPFPSGTVNRVVQGVTIHPLHRLMWPATSVSTAAARRPRSCSPTSSGLSSPR